MSMVNKKSQMLYWLNKDATLTQRESAITKLIPLATIEDHIILFLADCL